LRETSRSAWKSNQTLRAALALWSMSGCKSGLIDHKAKAALKVWLLFHADLDVSLKKSLISESTTLQSGSTLRTQTS
jgi:hypothetical protein